MNKLLSKINLPYHLIKRPELPKWKALLYRAIGLLAGFILMDLLLLAFAGANPIEVVECLFRGSFGSSRRVWVTFRELALMLMVALALVPAFKMKFWNLGGNGQILIGDLMAIVCMYFMGNAGCPDWAIILVMIPSSILGGMIWALIPAIFKAFFNTNESLFTLMLNYIAACLVSIFIASVATSGSGTLSIIEKGNLVSILGEDYLLTIICALGVLALVVVFLRFHKWGYELSVVGESENTAKYIGINVKKTIIRTMAISGAICGLVGLLLAGSLDHTINADSARNLGFTAILVAWLSQFNPLTMVGTSFLVAFLNNGMSSVQSTFNITNDSIKDISISVLYFSIIAIEFVINYKITRTKKNVATLATATAINSVLEVPQKEAKQTSEVSTKAVKNDENQDREVK